MKQNLLTISIDSDKLKKFPEKFNFLNFFSKKINSRLICGAISLSAAFFIPVSTALAGHKPADPQIDCTRLQFITELADPLYEQCVSASAAGNAAASLELARLYLNGGGSIEKNSAEGVRMMKIAGQQGSDTAVLELGLLYLNGEHVEKDVKTAQEYFRRISGVNGQAAMMLAEIKMSEAYELSYGSGKVRRNERRALELYRQVAGSPSTARRHSWRSVICILTAAVPWLILPRLSAGSILHCLIRNQSIRKTRMWRFSRLPCTARAWA